VTGRFGNPSVLSANPGATSSAGSDAMVTRSSNRRSPSLLPPPLRARKLRPSSADRAPKCPIICATICPTTGGSSSTTYLPGSKAAGSGPADAFSTALRASAATSSRLASF
jgi:hypothetical protein